MPTVGAALSWTIGDRCGIVELYEVDWGNFSAKTNYYPYNVGGDTSAETNSSSYNIAQLSVCKVVYAIKVHALGSDKKTLATSTTELQTEELGKKLSK